MTMHTEWQIFDRVQINFNQRLITYTPIEINLIRFVLKNDASINGIPDGSMVTLALFSDENKFRINTNCVVIHEKNETSSFIFINTFDVQAHPLDYQEDKEIFRLVPNEGFLTGLAIHPWYLGSRFEFKVIDLFSSGLGISYCPSPSYVLIPNLELELRFMNEKTGASKIHCKVLSTITAQGVSETKLLILKNNNTKELRAFYQQAMACYKNVTLNLLKKLEAPLPLFKGNIKISYVNNSQELNECLELRRLAYSQKERSKLSMNMPLESFHDRFDEGALIFKFTFFNQILGTARIITQSDKSEIGTLTDIPDFILRRGFIEASRLATHFDYRGRDLFLLILQVLLKIGLLLERRYLLFDCEDHLLPVYQKFGAVLVKDAMITHPLENVRLNLVYIDIQQAIKGKNLPLSLYLFGLIPLQYHLIETGGMHANIFKRTKVSFLYTLVEYLQRFIL